MLRRKEDGYMKGKKNQKKEIEREGERAVAGEEYKNERQRKGKWNGEGVVHRS
jgi:hypothetical protein